MFRRWLPPFSTRCQTFEQTGRFLLIPQSPIPSSHCLPETYALSLCPFGRASRIGHRHRSPLRGDASVCGSVATCQQVARQNVILELGYFLGGLGRSRVMALRQGEVNFLGLPWRLYEPLTTDGAWKMWLAVSCRRRDLKSTGMRSTHEVPLPSSPAPSRSACGLQGSRWLEWVASAIQQ